MYVYHDHGLPLQQVQLCYGAFTVYWSARHQTRSCSGVRESEGVLQHLRQVGSNSKNDQTDYRIKLQGCVWRRYLQAQTDGDRRIQEATYRIVQVRKAGDEDVQTGNPGNNKSKSATTSAMATENPFSVSAMTAPPPTPTKGTSSDEENSDLNKKALRKVRDVLVFA